MAIAQSNKLSVTSTTQTDYIKLSKGKNRVFVYCSAWSTTSLKLRLSHDGSDTNAGHIKPTPNGSDLVFTANESFVLEGPGYLGAKASAYGGTAVTIEIQDGQ